MTTATKNIIRSAIDLDGSATEAERAAARVLLAGGNRSAAMREIPQVVSYAEAADALHLSRWRVYQLVKKGVLRAAKLPGVSRSSGILAESLTAALA